MDNIGSFKTQQEARVFASNNKGNEAITKNQDGSFGVHQLNAEENKSLETKDFSNLSKDIIEFSAGVSGSPDKIINRLSSEKFKKIDDARVTANNNPGHETIAKNQDGTFSVFPFLDDKMPDVEKRDFSKFDKNTVEVSVEKSPGESKIINTEDTTIGQKAKTLLNNIETLLKKVSNKPKDTNEYTRGGDKVDIDKGIVAADCSGFVSEILNSADVEVPRMTASSIGDTIRKASNPFFDRVKLAKEIKPGDVISYENVKGGITGHVMIVLDKPEPIKKNDKIVGYNLKVADSTTIDHSNDARRGGRGVGTGGVSVKVDPNGNMTGFHWRSNLEWRNESPKVTVGRIKE